MPSAMGVRQGRQHNVCVEEVPVISVIVPTRGRPVAVCVAIASALSQSFERLEVVVVVDGLDVATAAKLQAIADARLRVVQLNARVGAAEARNVGVRTARGDWIAFLDDDDEWLPGKLARQINAAQSSRATFPVICGAYWARQDGRDILFGRRCPAEDEVVSEYMFCRSSWTYGENALATSVLLVPKALMERVPFESDLDRHQDWDWALRALALPETSVVYIEQPLSVYNMPDGVERISEGVDWRTSLSWGRLRRGLLTDRAFAGFVITECMTRARCAGASKRELWGLIRTVFEEGEPEARMLALLAGLFILPMSLRLKLRELLRFGLI